MRAGARRGNDLFHCLECGAAVRMAVGANRTYPYEADLDLPIPPDLEALTCGGCNAVYLDDRTWRLLRPTFEKASLAMQPARYERVLQAIRAEHGDISDRDLARACGVTPWYFVAILRGKQRATATLTRLLEAFALLPSELRRHLAAHPPQGRRLKRHLERKARSSARK